VKAPPGVRIMAFVSHDTLAAWSTGVVPDTAARCAWTEDDQQDGGWWPDDVKVGLGDTGGSGDVYVNFRTMAGWYEKTELKNAWASKVC
jgi:hypothetical protein